LPRKVANPAIAPRWCSDCSLPPMSPDAGAHAAGAGPRSGGGRDFAVDSPPLDAIRFLVEAVVATPSRDPARPKKPSLQPIEDRVIWVIDRFARLQRRDRLLRGRSPIRPAN
jgi:hypothetical protein